MKLNVETKAKSATQRSMFLSMLLGISLFLGIHLAPALGQASQQTRPPEAVRSLQTAQSLIAKQAALVSEFEVNGLKVLVKRREGSQTVVAGLFMRGGSRNVTAEDAGVEALMLDVASEATQNFPREQLRRELARTGTNLSYGINNDYSALT